MKKPKKVGCIVPKKGVDSEYDSVLMELEEIKKDSEQYLEKQKKTLWSENYVSRFG